MRSPDHPADLDVAMRACEEACRQLSAACLEVDQPAVKTEWSIELLSRAIDVAYVAGAAARLLARRHVMTADSLAMQLGVCRQIADELGDFCRVSALSTARLCVIRAGECAIACAALRARLTPPVPARRRGGAAA